MQLNKVNNVSFKRIGFVDKSVKKAFDSALKQEVLAARTERSQTACSFCLWLLKREKSRHDRMLRIGMKQINNKNYFTNAITNEIIGVKEDRQTISAFIFDLVYAKQFPMLTELFVDDIQK